MCRLDYLLFSTSALNTVVNYQIKTGYNLNFIQHDEGTGCFKLNNSLLLDTEYQTQIKRSIQKILSFNKEANPNIFGEIIKGRIRDETIEFTSLKKKIDLQNELDINLRIKDLDTTLIKNLKSEQNALNNLIDKIIKGVVLRSKAEWVEGSGKNSKYFANLETKKSRTESGK